MAYNAGPAPETTKLLSRGEYYRLIAELDSALRQAALQYRSVVSTTDIQEYAEDGTAQLVVTIRLPKADYRPDIGLSAVRAATGDTIRLEEGRR